MNDTLVYSMEKPIITLLVLNSKRLQENEEEEEKVPVFHSMSVGDRRDGDRSD